MREFGFTKIGLDWATLPALTNSGQCLQTSAFASVDTGSFSLFSSSSTRLNDPFFVERRAILIRKVHF
jgi:hypothetical protein